MSSSKATKTTLITSEHEKGLKALSLFRAKYDKQRFNGDRAQRLNGSHEFWAGVEDLMRRCSATNQYASEEVASSYTYPPEYTPKPLELQVEILRRTWPKLQPGKQLIELERQPLVSGAEAVFAFVRFQALAPIYNDAFVKEILPALAQSRGGKFYNYRESKLGPPYFRMSINTSESLDALYEFQKSDILVVPMQYGLMYRGKSVRRARELFGEGEFGVSSLMAGSTLIVHPEREVRWEQLHINCAGDEYLPEADGQFPCAPSFYCYDDGKLYFVTHDVSHQDEYYGSASAWLPQ